MTIEDIVLGIDKPTPKTETWEAVFSNKTKFEVKAVGKDNTSIVTGETIKNILGFEDKQKLACGKTFVIANGIEIKRIIEVEPVVRENRTVEETETVAPKPKKKKRVADD